MNEQKRILMIAHGDVVEGLRMASGLTLLDDEVRVAILAAPSDAAAAEEQLEALDFADVEVDRMTDTRDYERLADLLIHADVVYAI